MNSQIQNTIPLASIKDANHQKKLDQDINFANNDQQNYKSGLNKDLPDQKLVFGVQTNTRYDQNMKSNQSSAVYQPKSFLIDSNIHQSQDSNTLLSTHHKKNEVTGGCIYESSAQNQASVESQFKEIKQNTELSNQKSSLIMHQKDDGIEISDNGQLLKRGSVQDQNAIKFGISTHTALLSQSQPVDVIQNVVNAKKRNSVMGSTSTESHREMLAHFNSELPLPLNVQVPQPKAETEIQNQQVIPIKNAKQTLPMVDQQALEAAQNIDGENNSYLGAVQVKNFNEVPKQIKSHGQISVYLKNNATQIDSNTEINSVEANMSARRECTQRNIKQTQQSKQLHQLIHEIGIGSGSKLFFPSQCKKVKQTRKKYLNNRSQSRQNNSRDRSVDQLPSNQMTRQSSNKNINQPNKEGILNYQEQQITGDADNLFAIEGLYNHKKDENIQILKKCEKDKVSQGSFIVKNMSKRNQLQMIANRLQKSSEEIRRIGSRSASGQDISYHNLRKKSQLFQKNSAKSNIKFDSNFRSIQQQRSWQNQQYNINIQLPEQQSHQFLQNNSYRNLTCDSQSNFAEVQNQNKHDTSTLMVAADPSQLNQEQSNNQGHLQLNYQIGRANKAPPKMNRLKQTSSLEYIEMNLPKTEINFYKPQKSIGDGQNGI